MLLLVDGIIALVAVEFLALALLRVRTGRGIGAVDLLFNLLAGAGLMLALRAALAGDGGAWILGWLTLALVAHVVDLARRWRRG
jgi:hypothetical protein